MNDYYICRVSENNKSWTQPCGKECPKEKQSFAYRYGFNFDEWLFSKNWNIDNWHHAFLQGVHKLKASSLTRTRPFNVVLFTIEKLSQVDPPCHRYIGLIHNVECLEKNKIQSVKKHYEEKGWLKEMHGEIKKAGGKISALTKSSYRDIPFNIRFNPGNLKIFKRPIYARPDNPITKWDKYDMLELSTNQRLEMLHPILTLL